PARVDVNVHPTKREVRFSDSNVIHHLISETIRHRLDQAPWKEGGGQPEPTLAKAQPEGWSWGEPQERVRNALEDFMARSPRQEIGTAQFSRQPELAKQAKVGMLDFQELRLIGQFDATYLVCESRGSLLLIDQHAAHERIGFEQLKKSYLAGRLVQQGLLTPLTFQFAEGEAAKLRSCLEALEKFGFAVDEFGENTFVLKAHPTLLKDCDWSALLREIAEELEEQPLAGLEERIDHVLATMACHRQIRAHHRLADDEMRALLQQLEGTPRSYHCPHGRPVMVEIAAEEIEKWFKRIV
ncbi:MAG TPA: hypothetical protein VJP40_07680, partial [bacterium]|nr:hypothetical protein [bacterium]